jgi:hypothetical protein
MMSPKRAKSVPEQTSKRAPGGQWAVEELMGEKKVAMNYIRE